MLFISRLVLAAGALLASVRETSRPDPGGLTNFLPHCSDRALSPLQTSIICSSALKAFPSQPVSRFTESKGRADWVRPTIRSSGRFRGSRLADPISRPPSSAIISNRTIGAQASSNRVMFSVSYYDGPKDLALIDDRRAVALYRQDGVRDLAVYSRPSAVVVYMPPIQYIRFWVDPQAYQVVAYVYRPRFVIDGSLFREYVHLEPANFERCVYEASDAMLAGDRSIFREVFGLVRAKYVTIGDFERRPEEQASRILAGIYAWVVVVLVVFKALGDDSAAQQAPEGIRDTAILLFGSDRPTLHQIERQIPLVGGESKPELAACSGDEWWNGAQREVDLDVSGSLTTSPYFLTYAPEPAKPTPAPASHQQKISNLISPRSELLMDLRILL